MTRYGMGAPLAGPGWAAPPWLGPSRIPGKNEC